MVRGLNQIVDMNQKSEFAQSFKFVLQKIYFDLEISEFVAEMRHAIVHKNFPSTHNIRMLASIIINWCFLHFWKPLLLNNLKKFSSQRLRLLWPFFVKSVDVRTSKILDHFRNPEQRRVGEIGDDCKGGFAGLWEVHADFGNTGDFRKNLTAILKFSISGADRHSKKLFEIEEIDEELSEQSEASSDEDQKYSSFTDEARTLTALKICLNPAKHFKNRYLHFPNKKIIISNKSRQGMKKSVYERRKEKLESRSIQGKPFAFTFLIDKKTPPRTWTSKKKSSKS